ncbi:hypothetical protein B566_EDAN008231 [Ephemera danica]|nr:hypothetical protein B566_EDAN008231 [Ephemera danica]
MQQLRAQQLLQQQQQQQRAQQQQQQQRSIAQQQQQQRALAQQQQASRQASANKYPPPLVSSNGTSQSSRSPQQSQQQQQQLRTSSRNSQPEDEGTRKLIPIQDVPAITGHHMPYKVQKALIEGRMVPCINAKPYQNAELLMTMSDLVEQFFPSVQLHTCRKVLQEVLHIDLYRGNKLQMQVLHQAGKCSSPSEVLPLVQVRSIMQFMPQMSYMFNRMGSNASNDQLSAKRQRTS